MCKLFSVLLVGVATSLISFNSAHACGGGGGGGGSCGSSARGRSSGGARATAAPKATSGGPSVASAKAKTRIVSSTKTKAAAAKPTSYYTCPMHPQIRWTKPDDCPICGMKLKLKASKAPGKAAPSQDPANADTEGAASEHEAMDMGDGQGGMDDMEGMDEMMMCPGCMGGMSGMGGGKQKATGRPMRGMAGRGCGC